MPTHYSVASKQRGHIFLNKQYYNSITASFFSMRPIITELKKLIQVEQVVTKRLKINFYFCAKGKFPGKTLALFDFLKTLEQKLTLAWYEIYRKSMRNQKKRNQTHLDHARSKLRIQQHNHHKISPPTPNIFTKKRHPNPT